jgi:hypothetical protein
MHAGNAVSGAQGFLAWFSVLAKWGRSAKIAAPPSCQVPLKSDGIAAPPKFSGSCHFRGILNLTDPTESSTGKLQGVRHDPLDTRR